MTSSGVVIAEHGTPAAGQRRWVISRALCRYRRFSLPPALRAQRRIVLRNLLQAWQPFDNPAFCIIMRADSALAWAWDSLPVQGHLAQAGAPANASVYPEALLATPPEADGLRLVHAVEGVDAQIWHEGQLMASRWWPSEPDADEWTRWSRSADLEQVGDPVTLRSQAARWQLPWAEGVGLDTLISGSSRLERVALVAALAGLVGLSSAQLHQAWATYSERQALASERDRLAAAAAPVIGAQDRALALAAEATALSRQLAAPQPLEVLQHLAERLPPRGVTLKELELDASRLRIALEAAPEVARTQLVKELQVAGWFTQVTEVRDTGGRGWLWFEMQVQGLRPPAGPVAAGTGQQGPSAPSGAMPPPAVPPEPPRVPAGMAGQRP